MAEYAKKTCNQCGIRMPQNKMYRVEIEYRSGSSNTGLTGRAVFGSLIGNKRSRSQVGKFLLSPTKRTYRRRREVWMCGKCSGHTASKTTLNIFFWFAVILVVIGLFTR